MRGHELKIYQLTHILTHLVPVLPSYRNFILKPVTLFAKQIKRLVSMRATLVFNGLRKYPGFKTVTKTVFGERLLYHALNTFCIY